MLKEFKTFIIRGNVIDLAVGLIIGAAFGKIVTSFVTDVLTPPLGKLMGRIDFSQLVIDLSGQGIESLEQAKATGAPVIRYGLFFNVLLDFIITGFAIFCLVKAINRLKEKPQAAAEDPKTKDCPYCLTTIPLKATRCGHCTSQLTPQ